MPYTVIRSDACPTDRPFAVVKEGETKPRGCHPSKEDAMKQVAALYANEPGKAVLSSGQREALPDSAFACPEKRLYPHHHADGSLDLPHLRNALSRVAQAGTDSCGKAHLEAHARAESIGEAGKAFSPIKASVLDEDHLRLLAIPFVGMLPSPFYKHGVDLDGQTFAPDVDIRPDWFPYRLVDFHHRADQRVGSAIVGKAYLDEEPSEDGWWVDMWLNKQSRHFSMISRLIDKGVQLFGSAEAPRGIPKLRLPSGEVVPWKAKTAGEIVYWPYMKQTISPTPQNLYSVLQPLKASLDEYQAEGIAPEASFFRDLTAYLDDLVAGPDSDLTGEESAKAGRVLAARNEDRLREGISELEQAGWNPVVRKRALSLFASVLDELDRYTKQENP